ncbi:hypothetical protein MXB_3019, partial [Myxobolus squamalis]
IDAIKILILSVIQVFEIIYQSMRQIKKLKVLEESSKETLETKVKIIEDLIEYLRIYSNYLKADGLFISKNTTGSNHISTLNKSKSISHSKSVNSIDDISLSSQQNSNNVKRK